MGSASSNTSNPSILDASMRTHMGIQYFMRQFQQDEITKWSERGGKEGSRDGGNMGSVGRRNQGDFMNGHKFDTHACSISVLAALGLVVSEVS